MIFSPREKIIFSIVLGLVVLMLVIKLVVTPTVRKWKESAEQIVKLEQEYTDLRSWIAKEEHIRDQWSEKSKNIPTVDSKDSDTSFLDHLKKLRERAGISSLRNIREVRREQQPEFTRVVYELKFECDINELSRFLYRLAKSSECLRVSRIVISSRINRSKKAVLDVDIQIATLVIGEMS